MVKPVRGVTRTVPRGFSLVELLVVMVIILVVIAIVVPSLGGARNVARMSTTQTIIKEFGNAADAFRQDRDGRLPGVFRPDEMGHPENASTYGFTAMENAILDLAGGVVYTQPGGIGGGGQQGNARNFGPSADALQLNRQLGRSVNVDLIGADVEGNPRYYTPPGRYFVRQKHTSTDSVDQQWAAPSVRFGVDYADIPDLVDAWGNPLLLWVEDETGPGRIRDIQDFARVNSGSGASRFYWASNAGFLRATEMGQSGRNQTADANRAHSLLGGGLSNARIQTTLAGMLGNPAFPVQADLDGVTFSQVLPASARGRLVVQSAGTDGIFLSTRDTGSRQLDAESDGLHYGLNFFTRGNARHSRDGASTTLDVLQGFDDIIVTFGN